MENRTKTIKIQCWFTDYTIGELELPAERLIPSYKNILERLKNKPTGYIVPEELLPDNVTAYQLMMD